MLLRFVTLKFLWFWNFCLNYQLALVSRWIMYSVFALIIIRLMVRHGMLSDIALCSQCGRVYMHQSSLLRHLRFECGIEPQFTCMVCERKFQYKGYLRKHMLKTHQLKIPSFWYAFFPLFSYIFVFATPF